MTAENYKAKFAECVIIFEVGYENAKDDIMLCRGTYYIRLRAKWEVRRLVVVEE